MALPPKVPPYSSSPALATAVSRVAVRGRLSAAPQIEELNQTSVGTDGEWTPSDLGRVRPEEGRAGQGTAGGFGSALTRLASGYQANESPPSEQPTSGGPQPRNATGAYEMAMRVTGVGGPSVGNRLDRLY